MESIIFIESLIIPFKAKERSKLNFICNQLIFTLLFLERIENISKFSMHDKKWEKFPFLLEKSKLKIFRFVRKPIFLIEKI